MAQKKRRQAQPFPFKEFSPKQGEILGWWKDESRSRSLDGIIADGSVRAGKTVAMTLSFFDWSLAKMPGREFILSGKSIGSLERNVLRPAFQMFAAAGVHYEYRLGDYRQLEVGSNLYYCFGAGDERSQDYVQGLTAAGFYADEVALQNDSFIQQCKARLSVDGAKQWYNCNPEGPFHPVKRDLIDKAVEKRLLHLHFTMDDNRTLSRAVRERLERSFVGLHYLRKIKGLWVLAEGSIYSDCWDSGPGGTEFDDSDVPVGLYGGGYQQRLIGIDYGTTNPTVFLEALDDGKTVWFTREYYWDSKAESRQKTDSEYADDLMKFIGDHTDSQIILDPSAASFAAELRRRGLIVHDAKNAVLDGIRHTSSCLALGIARFHKKLDHTKAEMLSYVWDEKAAQRGEEKPVKAQDHVPDACRYILFTKIPEWRLMLL